jgi:DNA-binding beta-propeller fold protein YncE
MQLLDAASGRLLRSISVDAYPSMIVVDASTNHGFVVSNNGATQMVDATSGQVLRTIPVNGIGCSIGAGVDERANHLFIPRLTGVSVIDTRSGSVLRTIPMRQASGLRYGCAGSLLASPTGVDERTRRVFVGGFMGFASDGLSMLDARDGRLLRTVKPGSPALAVAVDERAGRVFVARDGARELDVLDAATGTVVRRIHVGALCKAVAVDERTGHAFVIAGRGTVPLSDIWSWLPSWMRRWMPFLPRSRARPVPSRVTTLDVER